MIDKDIFDSRLLYYGLEDFMGKRKLIKEVLFEQTERDQYLYKLYLYSRPFISETWKDYMWDWLQSDISEEELIYYFSMVKRKHQD